MTGNPESNFINNQEIFIQTQPRKLTDEDVCNALLLGIPLEKAVSIDPDELAQGAEYFLAVDSKLLVGC